MKIRSLHPGFFSDRKLTGLPYEARLLFAGLWCRSDDYGRGLYLPKSIEGDVFPVDTVNIVELLLMLENVGLIRLYDNDGERFYEVSNWNVYQSPKYKSKNKMPDPDGYISPGQVDTGLFAPLLENSSAKPDKTLFQGEGEGEGVLLAAAPRNRDPVWDVLVTLFGEPSNDNTRGKRNRVVKLLKQSSATEEEIDYRYAAWSDHFPDATITDTGLANQWDTLGRPPVRSSKDGKEWTSGGVAEKLDPAVCPHYAVNDEGFCVACETETVAV